MANKCFLAQQQDAEKQEKYMQVGLVIKSLTSCKKVIEIIDRFEKLVITMLSKRMEKSSHMLQIKNKITSARTIVTPCTFMELVFNICDEKNFSHMKIIFVCHSRNYLPEEISVNSSR